MWPDETILLYPRGAEISSTPPGRLRLELLTSMSFSAHGFSADMQISWSRFVLRASPPHFSPPHGGSEPFDESLRLKMGAETMEPLSPAQLRVWRAQLTPEAQALAGNLPVEEPLDLMDSTRRHFVSLWPRW